MTPSIIIEHNRQALLRLIAMVFEIPGLGLEKPALTQFMRGTLLFYLRPMESALRRLIFVQAQGLVVKLRAKRAAPSKPIPRGTNSERIPAFRLIDPRKRFAELTGPKRPAKGPGPRIWFFDGTDPPFTSLAKPKKAKPKPDDLIDSTKLLRRLQALKAALDDLPKQAKRMAREMERRKSAPPGPRKVPPIRGGWPPGYRARGKYDVDEVLRECHWLAIRVMNAPDTS